VVAGDLNTDTRNETALTTFRTFLNDAIPTDQAGDPDTNLSRAKPYDYVLTSFNLASNQTVTVVGTNRFANGLVFDSRVRPLLFDPGVVFTNDSSAVNMQHMAVVKDFRIAHIGDEPRRLAGAFALTLVRARTSCTGPASAASPTPCQRTPRSPTGRPPEQ
jgi:hypothetical protein